MAIQPSKIQPIYSWHTTVSTFDVAPDRRLTLSGQLRLQQQVAELHFGEGGADFRGMAENRLAFVSVQNNAVLYRRPLIGDAITVQTWARPMRGVRFFRGYRFLDEAGETLIDSVCSFALVDLNTHALLRPSSFPSLDELPFTAREQSCPDPQKLTLPADAAPCGTHTVRYSQLDFNGHLNNTCYADILCDYCPVPLNEAALAGFSIAYLQEACANDTLTLYAALTEDGKRLRMRSDNGERPCFLAELCWR